MNFLERYKILFEVGAATLLALMAIVVSSAQMFSAQEQTKLLALQTQITEAQALPQFAIRRTLNKDEDILTIENRGGHIRLVHAEVYDALFVEVLRPNRRRISYLPLIGYHDRASDLILPVVTPFAVKAGRSKREALQSFRRELARYRYTRRSTFSGDSATFKIGMFVTVIRITYVDVLKREHVAWFASMDDFTRLGELPVVPVDDTRLTDLFEDWEFAEPIEVNNKFTPVFVRTISREILDNEFGVIDMLLWEIKGP